MKLNYGDGASFVTTNNFQNELKICICTGDETKKVLQQMHKTENEAVNKKQIDELELRLNDSIETIKGSLVKIQLQQLQ